METTQFLTGNTVGNLYVDLPDGTQYIAITRNNISIVQIAPQHYEEMLNRRCGCCDSYHKCFHPTTPEELVKWNRPE